MNSSWTSPVAIIAEIGSVHDGSFGNACRLIEAAAAAGATAVKFQTHVADAETLPDAPMPPYFKGEPRLEYFRRTAFTEPQYRRLMQVAADHGVAFVASPFALEAVDFLAGLGLGYYKIPSGEVTNLPLLERVATTGRPVLLSSGMSTWDELDQAVAVLRGSPLLVMQCSSVYPCPPPQVGLNVMSEMKNRYRLPVGYSDHTRGIAAPVAAAALGAVAIEKHFAFSRMMYGSDAGNSMEPAEFRQMADAVRETWEILAHPVDKSLAGSYAEMKLIFEKSIVAAHDLGAGTVLATSHLAFKKPGDGIRADRYQALLGRRLKVSVPANTPLREEWLELI
jgi:N-acetylneuraminate synthase